MKLQPEYAVRVCGDDISAPKKKGDVGYDLAAPADLVIPFEQNATISLDVWVEMPFSLFALVLPRSGNNLRGLFSQTGVIDPGYRGKIGVVLQNRSGDDVRISKGDRIAQLVFFPAIRPNLVHVESPDFLTRTERGDSGFGSTGT